ncbi:MAG: trypsin-like peptidase domain-containing protein [Lentisphaeria bacterium]|nr:trypsin-like peptidase domain-containing protein [Lentisphaeria bacterium]
MIRYAFSILLVGQLSYVVRAQEATHVIPDAIVQKVGPSVVAIQHRRAGGSGFIISADGYILSNGHVVTRNDPEFPTEAEESVTVILDDERKYSATVIGFSMDPDVSLLKINPDEPLKPVEFADSRRVTTGQKCFAVGTPVGLKRTFTSGILSNVDRADLGTFTKVLQTDAAINQGNSGGPLFDENGRVLGINTYARGGNNLGFTIPIHVALTLKDHFLAHGRFVRSGFWFCLLGETYDELAETLGVSGGVIVHHVEPGTTVAEAGLRSGDVIVAVDGAPCAPRTHAEFLDFNWDLSTREPGTTVQVTVSRDEGGKRVPVSLRLPVSEFDQVPPGGLQPGNLITYSYQALGFGYQEIALLTRIYYNLTDHQGVIVTGVDGNSAAAEAGIGHYDIITHINDEPVTDVASFERLLEARLADRTPVIPMTIQRRSHTYRTALAPRYELGGKTAVALVPRGGFEYLEMLRRELLADGADVVIRTVEPGAFSAADIDLEDVDMVVLCDSAPSSELITNEEVFTVIRAAHAKERVLAAVGASSLALVKAEPALLDKRVTTSPDAAGDAVKLGATYTGKDVEEESKIVTTTGRNRRVMKMFVKKLAETAR